MKASKLIKQLERMVELYGDKEVCLWEIDAFRVVDKEIKWIQTTAEDIQLVKFRNDDNLRCSLDRQEVFMIEK